MNTSNLLYSTIFFFLIFISSHFSQTNQFNKFSENEFNESFPAVNRVNSKNIKTLTKQNSNSGMQVDNIISFNEGGRDYKYNYFYDSSEKLISQLQQKMGGTKWYDFKRKTYQYDSNDKIHSELFESWSNPQSEWIIDSTFTYEYGNSEGTIWWTLDKGYEKHFWHNIFDNKGHLVAHSHEIYNDYELFSSERNEYEYDSFGKRISELWESWQADGFSEPNRRYTFTYHELGNMTGILEERFQEDQWQYYQNSILSYYPNKILFSRYDELWDGSNWINLNRKYFNYDSRGNPFYTSKEIWDGSIWIFNNETVYFYDSDDNCTMQQYWCYENDSCKRELEFHDSFGRIFSVYGKMIVVSYKNVTAVDDENIIIPNFSLSQNYPNPFNPSTTIKYSIPQNSFVQLSIYNILGQKVANLVSKEQLAGNYEIVFDAFSIISGVYFYTLQSGDLIETKKLILLK